MELQKEASKIFDDLFMATFKQLALMGIHVEPGDVVRKVISPVKDVYLKGLVDLLDLTSAKENGKMSEAEAEALEELRKI